MNHETTIKRQDGTRYNIVVNLTVEYMRDTFSYNVMVYKCESKKRTFYSVIDTDDFKWRKLSMEERQNENQRIILTHVSAEELLNAKMQLWEKIKPTL